MTGGKPKVVVLGGIYVDMAIRCEDFPDSAELVPGSEFSHIPTGSGINQAIQAALCGCQVTLVGKVGNDPFGQMVIDNLRDFGINCDFIFEAEAKNTGVTLSFVNSAGSNRTVVSEGANRALTPSDISGAKFEELISNANICLVNGKLPPDFVSAAIRAAKLSNKKVILDPALPGGEFQHQSVSLPPDYYTADILVPNFVEAAEIINPQNHNIHNAKLIGADLIARGVGCAVIKLGRRGALVIDKAGADHIPSFEVKFVDRTGCGDAFDGALAASCAVGSAKGCLTADEIRKAVKFASAAGALACSKFGSQESLPKKEEIIELLQDLP